MVHLILHARSQKRRLLQKQRKKEPQKEESRYIRASLCQNGRKTGKNFYILLSCLFYWARVPLYLVNIAVLNIASQMIPDRFNCIIVSVASIEGDFLLM